MASSWGAFETRPGLPIAGKVGEHGLDKEGPELPRQGDQAEPRPGSWREPAAGRVRETETGSPCRATSGPTAGPWAMQGTGFSAEKGHFPACMFSRSFCFIPLEEKMKTLVPLTLAVSNFLSPKLSRIRHWQTLPSFKRLFLSHECRDPASGPSSAPRTIYATPQGLRASVPRLSEGVPSLRGSK